MNRRCGSRPVTSFLAPSPLMTYWKWQPRVADAKERPRDSPARPAVCDAANIRPGGNRWLHRAEAFCLNR